jgi:hypothetical protein
MITATTNTTSAKIMLCKILILDGHSRKWAAIPNLDGSLGIARIFHIRKLSVYKTRFILPPILKPWLLHR